jgi:hypothetical protein
MSSDLHSRLLAEIEQLRRNILEQSLALERLSFVVSTIHEEIRGHNRGCFVLPTEN